MTAVKILFSRLIAVAFLAALFSLPGMVSPHAQTADTSSDATVESFGKRPSVPRRSVLG